MAGRCSICKSEQLEAINTAIINGESNRRIAAQFSLSETAIRRHKTDHLPVALCQAREAGEIAAADTLLAQVEQLRIKAWSLLNQAEAVGDLRTALHGIREARGCLELLGKVAGELQQEGAVSITFAPGWIEIRTTIIKALEPYPAALLALSEAWDQDGEIDG